MKAEVFLELKKVLDANVPIKFRNKIIAQ